MGRWSRLVARRFVPWVGAPRNASWLDVGTGTGALAQTILDTAWPGRVAGVDASRAYVEHARSLLSGITFEVADARSLPFDDRGFNVVVAGLCLNFIPDPAATVAEMRRVARDRVAAYVWDYESGMRMLRIFWDAAAALDPAAAELDEAARFPICRPDALTRLFAGAGLRDVQVDAIDVETAFNGFDDYWTPFLGGQAPAPSYCVALPEEARARLRERVRSELPVGRDGRIRLPARAWAVRGRPEAS